MRKYLTWAAVLLLMLSVRAVGDYNATQGAGTIFRAFDATHNGTSLCAAANTQCQAVGLVNSAGAEIGTSGAPVRVDPTGTTPQPVSGTVTANLGTIAGVATAAKQPALGTAGAASTDVITVQGIASGTTIPVSATLSAETTKVIGTVRGLGNAGAITDFAGQNAASPANSWLMGGQFNTTPTTLTNGNASPLQLDNAGKLIVNCATGCSASTSIANWAGGVLGAMANYGTSPGAVLVPGVNAFVTNTNANGQATMANSSPVVIASNQSNLSTTPYPLGATPITSSATGTTGATTATLAGSASVTTYICGFSIRANATAAVTGNATVTGTITGTLNFTQWTAPAASGVGIAEMVFNPCVPASATNTAIAVVSAAPGTGGVVSSTAWGYRL